MNMLDAAVQLANAGRKVFPLHTITDGACSCGRSAGNTCTPGKHPDIPPSEISPSDIPQERLQVIREGGGGVYAASADEVLVRDWWRQRPAANIGLALGAQSDGLMALDIDNPRIAQQVIELFRSGGGPESFAVALTGREGGGCHVYFTSKGSQDGVNLSTEEGERLGELRGSRQYVVAPPSLHLSGRRYTFVHGDIVDWPLARVEDPLAVVTELLMRVDVTVARTAAKARKRYQSNGPIEMIRCPFDTRGALRLTQLLSGMVTTTDRSATLWALGCELWLQAQSVGYLATEAEIAGVIKLVDARVYQKYSWRRDADIRYWEKVEDSENAVLRGEYEEDPQERRYRYTEGVGLEFVNSSNRMVRLANFKPILIEEQQIVGSDGQTVETGYLLRCELPNEETELRFLERDLHSDRPIRAIFSKLSHSKYEIEPDQFYRTWLAARNLAGSVPVVKRFAAPGWAITEGAIAFAVPGADPVEGLSSDIIQADISESSPERYQLYGMGMRPIADADEKAEAAAALEALLRMLPPHVLIPMIDVVLGAPLNSMGLRTSPPLVHIYGKTGQLKTSSALAVLSLLGKFTGLREIPESWSSTVASLQHALHVLRDLPLLIDDYKTSHMRAVDAERLVQNYADGTVRSRMGAEQERRESLVPQAFLLSTGEDRWEQEESAQARMLSVEIPYLEPGSDDFRARSARIRQVQDYAARGVLARIGASYIQFLARWLRKSGGEDVTRTLTRWRKEELERPEFDLAVHARVLDTTATLRVIERVIGGYIKQTFPDLLPAWLAAQSDAWNWLRDWIVEESIEAADLSPAQQVLAAIRGAVLTGDARLKWRYSEGGYGDSSAHEVAAVYDDDGVYLMEHVTWAWYRRTQMRQGERPPFSWRAVKADARNVLGGYDRQLKEDNNRRAVCVPHEAAKLLDVRNQPADLLEP